MAVKSQFKKRRRATPHSLHKPRGVVHPRVQAVGPEHFAFLCVDCAKARSKIMLADFYGRVLLEPTTVEHNRSGFRELMATIMCRYDAVQDQGSCRRRRTHGSLSRTDSSVPFARPGSRSASFIPSPPNNFDSPPIPATRPTIPTSPQSTAPPSMASACWSTKPTPSLFSLNSWRGTAATSFARGSPSSSKCSSIFSPICPDTRSASPTSSIPRSCSGLPRTSARPLRSAGRRGGLDPPTASKPESASTLPPFEKIVAWARSAPPAEQPAALHRRFSSSSTPTDLSKTPTHPDHRSELAESSGSDPLCAPLEHPWDQRGFGGRIRG